MAGVFGTVFQLLFFVMGLVQLAAVWSGFEVWLGLPSFIAFLLSLFVAFIPVIGAGVGIYGAIDAWGWTGLEAVGLFLGPYLVVMALMGIASLFSRS